MCYLVCTCPWQGHPGCGADWVAAILSRYRQRAQVTHGIVITSAPRELVERICSHGRPRCDFA